MYVLEGNGAFYDSFALYTAGKISEPKHYKAHTRVYEISDRPNT